MSDQRKYIDKLKNSRVLIIGGSSGIGYAVAEAILENSGHVIISSSNPSRISKAITTLQTSYPSCVERISGFPCDLSLETQIETNILSLLSQTAPLDHIIFTAGNHIPPSPITSATLSTIHSAATVRYIAPIFLAKHCQNYLRPNTDHSITLTTGIVSQRPLPNWSTIAGSRAAVIALAKNLALELKPKRVNVVCVGAVETEIWDGVKGEEKAALFERLVQKTTTGKMARPEDVAEAYVYCVRDGNVTGSVVVTDGGALLV